MGIQRVRSIPTPDDPIWEKHSFVSRTPSIFMRTEPDPEWKGRRNGFPDTIWPVDNDVAEPSVCVTHTRWSHPCLGDRHDDREPCSTIIHSDATEIVRLLHNGVHTTNEAHELLLRVADSCAIEMVEQPVIL